MTIKEIKKYKNREKKPVTKEMGISEVVFNYPQTADVFMSYGLHCIGCGMASFETIEQGAQVHGMDKKTLNNMIKEANETIKSSKEEFSNDDFIKITKRAIKQVSILIKKSKGSKYLRIAIIQTPYGNRYGFKFEKIKKKEDTLIQKEKIGFLLDKESAKLLQGATLDYLSFLPGNGFKIYPKLSL